MERLQLFDLSKIRRVLMPFVLFFTVFGLHILLSQASYFMVSGSRFVNMYDINVHFEDLTDVVSIVIIPMLFYSLVRLTTIFDEMIIPKVLEMAPSSFAICLRAVFRISKFYYEFLIIAVLWCILPMQTCFYPIWNVFLRGNDTMTSTVIVKAVFVVLMLLVFILAKMSAVRVIPLPKQRAESLMRDRIYITKKKKDGQDGFLKQLLIISLAYWMAPLALVLFIPFVLSFVQLFYYTITWKMFLYAALIVFAVFVLSYLRLLIKRRSFIQRLKKVVEENKIDISEIANPYRSLFGLVQGEDFNFTRGGKKYACKLLHARRRGTPMFISEGGICTFVHTLIVFKIKIFSYNTTFKFDFDADGQKLIIINPVPNDIMNAYDGSVTTLDNGDVIGGYKIFTASGFLNALERNCIDR